MKPRHMMGDQVCEAVPVSREVASTPSTNPSAEVVRAGREETRDDVAAWLAAAMAEAGESETPVLGELLAGVLHDVPQPSRGGSLSLTGIKRGLGLSLTGRKSQLLAEACRRAEPFCTLKGGGNAYGDTLPGSDLRGTEVPPELVAAAIRADRNELRGGAAAKMLDWLARLVEGDRTLPMSRGSIAIFVCLAMAGVMKGATSADAPEAIRKWAPFFRLDELTSRLVDGEVVREEGTVLLLNNHFEQLREEGRGFWEATGKHAGTACLTAIEAETGIPVTTLRKRRELIDAEAQPDRIGLGPQWPIRTGEDKVLFTARRNARLDRVRQLVAHGITLPALRSNHRAIDFAALAQLMGEEDDLADDQLFRQKVYGFKPVVNWLPGATRRAVTWRQLEDECVVRQREDYTGKKENLSVVLSRVRGAVDAIRGARGMDDIVLQEFGADLAQRVEDHIRDRNHRTSTGNSFRTVVKKVRDWYDAMTLPAASADGVIERIRIGIHRAKKPLPQLQQETGISRFVLAQLSAGLYPVTKSTAHLLQPLERALSFTPGHLTELIPMLPARPSEEAIDDRIMDARLKPHIPEWATMPREDFEEQVAFHQQHTLHLPTPTGAAMRAVAAMSVEARKGTRDEMRDRKLNAVGVNMRADLTQLTAHKTAPIAHDFRRRRKGQWTDTTAAMREGLIYGVVKHIVSPTDKEGLGWDKESFGFEQVVNPGPWLWEISAQAERLADVELPDGSRRKCKFTRMQVQFLELLASLCSEYGIVYQRPELAARLKPDLTPLPAIEHLAYRLSGSADPRTIQPPARVPAEICGLDPEQWRAQSLEAEKRYRDVAADLARIATPMRDPLLLVKPITDHDHPMALLCAHAALAREHFQPCQLTERQAYHSFRRGLVTDTLQKVLGFRPRNMRELRFRKFNGEPVEIWEENGAYWVRMHWEKFKNWTSCLLFGREGDRQPFLKKLPDQDGLYEMLHRYERETLPYYDKDGSCPTYLVSARGRPLSGMGIYAMVRKFTAETYAHNPYMERGIAGVLPFGPYAYRAIKASDILLNPTTDDRLVEAANGIQSGPEMVRRFYGQIRPGKWTEMGDASMEASYAMAQRLLLEMRQLAA